MYVGAALLCCLQLQFKHAEHAQHRHNITTKPPGFRQGPSEGELASCPPGLTSVTTYGALVLALSMYVLISACNLTEALSCKLEVEFTVTRLT